ncbi:MAG TPA: exosortase/archaeosortase family protein [Chthoniobacterales bacterium]|jgi:exosortase
MTTSTRPAALSWILPSAAILAIFAGLYFLFPYASGYGAQMVSLYTMFYALSTDYGSWGHCLLVFPIAAALIYWKAGDLAKIPVHGSNWGLLWIAFSMFLYWVGYKTSVHYFGFISVQIFVAGAILFFLGWEFFKAVLFPWAFLAFAWPFIFLDAEIAFPLRLRMSEACYYFLNLIGVPTMLNGTALLSAPDYVRNLVAGQRFQVDIADPCSGIRSLFALTMITSLYGYLTLPKTWQKFALLAMAFPLAIAGNFVRILILTFGTLSFGAPFAIGTLDEPTWFHTGAGYFVYVIALGGMALLGSLLAKEWGKKKESPAPATPVSTEGGTV